MTLYHERAGKPVVIKRRGLWTPTDFCRGVPADSIPTPFLQKGPANVADQNVSESVSAPEAVEWNPVFGQKLLHPYTLVARSRRGDAERERLEP
jgi:hypothetical protein